MVIAVVSVPSLVEERLTEARTAAELIGAELVDLSGQTPTRVEDISMHRLVARLDELVAVVRPDLVLTHARTDVHWDHGLVHQATLATLRRTPCDLFTFVSTSELNLATTLLGPCFADITEHLETKLAALRAHASQIARGSLDVASCRDLARAVGRLCGAEYGEAYQVLRLTL